MDRGDPRLHVLGRRSGTDELAPSYELFEHEGVRPLSGVEEHRLLHVASAHPDDQIRFLQHRRRQGPAAMVPEIDAVVVHHVEDLVGDGLWSQAAARTDAGRGHRHRFGVVVHLGGKEGGCHRGPADVGGADEEDVNVRSVSPGCQTTAGAAGSLVRATLPRRPGPRSAATQSNGGSRTALVASLRVGGGGGPSEVAGRTIAGLPGPTAYAQNPASRQSSTSQSPRFARPRPMRPTTDEPTTREESPCRRTPTSSGTSPTHWAGVTCWP